MNNEGILKSAFEKQDTGWKLFFNCVNKVFKTNFILIILFPVIANAQIFRNGLSITGPRPGDSAWKHASGVNDRKVLHGPVKWVIARDTKYIYNHDGRIIHVVNSDLDSVDNNSPGEHWIYENGKLIDAFKINDLGEHINWYEVNDKGQIIFEGDWTDRHSSIVSYKYDERGNVLSACYEKLYIRQRNNVGDCEYFLYDEQSRVIEHFWYQYGEERQRTRFIYDDVNNKTIYFSVDLNRITSITEYRNDENGTSSEISTSFNDEGIEQSVFITNFSRFGDVTTSRAENLDTGEVSGGYGLSLLGNFVYVYDEFGNWTAKWVEEITDGKTKISRFVKGWDYTYYQPTSITDYSLY